MTARAFLSWSGGKDPMLALHRALAGGWPVDAHELRPAAPAPGHCFVADLQ